MARKPDGNGKLDKLDEAMTALVHAQALAVQNNAALQQALLQHQILAERRYEELKNTMQQKLAEVDRRLENIEAFLVKMSAELPEKVFGFAQAQKKPN